MFTVIVDLKLTPSMSNTAHRMIKEWKVTINRGGSLAFLPDKS